MNDQGLEFKALAHKVKSMLDNISSLEIDNKKYRQKFDEIINEIEHSTSNNASRNTSQEMFLIQDYSTGITKLQKLEFELKTFDIYFKALNFAKYLDIQIIKTISEEEFEGLTNELVNILSALKKSSTLYYNDEKVVVEKIYEATYQMIKLEILKTGTNRIYDYCKKEEIDSYFLDRCIRRELEELNLQDEEYQRLNERKLFLESKGINTNYLDLDLIKIIMSYNDKDALRMKFVENLEQIIAEINNNTLAYQIECKKYNNTQKIIKIAKKRMNEFYIRIISCCLAASIYITGGIGVFHLGKKVTEEKITKSSTENFSNYEQEIKEDVIETVNDDIIIEKILLFGAFYFVYIMILIYFEGTFFETEYLGLANQLLEKILNNNNRNNIKDYKNYLKQLKDIINNIKEILNKDEVLRTRFNELFESNKFLLENPEELLSKIKKLNNNEEINRVLKKANK